MSNEQVESCGIGEALARCQQRGMKGAETMTQRGRLEVITGCMFSGKTEELLRRVERATIGKKTVLLVKPAIDTRYSEKEVITHYGRRQPCYRIPIDAQQEGLLELIGADSLAKVNIVAFDEGNFFGPHFPVLCEGLVTQGKQVIVAGLDLNFRGEPFGTMPILLALADSAQKLSAICVMCGRTATRTQRLIEGKPAKLNDPEILVGGLESYEARCRACWIGPEKPVE